jgi:uncharacterized protein (DUF697 family)
MLQKISKNGLALVLLIATLFNLDIDEKLADDIVSAVTLLASVGLMVWNQVTRRDIAKFLFRK